VRRILRRSCVHKSCVFCLYSVEDANDHVVRSYLSRLELHRNTYLSRVVTKQIKWVERTTLRFAGSIQTIHNITTHNRTQQSREQLQGFLCAIHKEENIKI
jgi:hypothetical protein